jgi:hypothetical protein
VNGASDDDMMTCASDKHFGLICVGMRGLMRSGTVGREGAVLSGAPFCVLI